MSIFCFRASTRANAAFSDVLAAFFIPTRPEDRVNKVFPGSLVTTMKMLFSKHVMVTCGGRVIALLLVALSLLEKKLDLNDEKEEKDWKRGKDWKNPPLPLGLKIEDSRGKFNFLALLKGNFKNIALCINFGKQNLFQGISC